MTSVSITTSQNSVVISGSGSSAVVTATTAGPRGPAGVGFDVNSTAKVDKSVVYYDASTNQFKADAIWTTSTLTFGGDF